MLDLVRLSPSPRLPAGGEALYRKVALLTDMGEASDVLVVPSGLGATLHYLVAEYGVRGSGVDEDARVVELAEEGARSLSLSPAAQFQRAPAIDLPYRDGIFDVVIGELGLTHADDPEAAVRELVRVTKPGGAVVLIQLVWKTPVEETRRRTLAQRIGTQPLMQVEWKRLLDQAGVEALHAESWSEDQTGVRASSESPLPDFAELFTVWERLGILRRVWGRWGWRGVRTALQREAEIHRVLTREHILGLDLLKGCKRGGDPATPEPERAESDPAQVEGLPLFGDGIKGAE